MVACIAKGLALCPAMHFWLVKEIEWALIRKRPPPHCKLFSKLPLFKIFRSIRIKYRRAGLGTAGCNGNTNRQLPPSADNRK